MSFDWTKLATDIPKQLDTVAEVPDEFKHLYDKDDSGHFVFKGSAVLFNSMTGAKAEKQELSAKLSAINAQMDKYAKLGDVAGLESLIAKKAEIEAANVNVDARIAELRQQSQEQLRTVENQYQGKVSGLETALQTTVRETMISSLISSANLTDEGKSILPQLLPQFFKVELADGYKPKIIVVDEKGSPRMNAKMDPMQPADVINEMREKFPSLFKGAGRTGGGSPGTDQATGSLPKNKQPSTWTAQEKSNYMREHGAKAYEELVKTEGAARQAEIDAKLKRRPAA